METLHRNAVDHDEEHFTGYVMPDLHSKADISAKPVGEDHSPWLDCSYDELEQNSIRVLYLRPGFFGPPLSAKFEKSLLEEPEVTYEALSYTWGKHVYSHSLQIDNVGTLGITESLHDALQHLRSTSETRRLWIDAICINQANKDERSSQVENMAEVYGNAEHVVVWLGLAGDSDALAFAAPSAFEAYVAENKAEFDGPVGATNPSNFLNFISSRLAEQPHCMCCNEQFQQSENESLYNSASRAITSLTHRPWFSRLWVLQEICMAGHKSEVYPNGVGQLCCGTHVASWDTFHLCLDRMHWINTYLDNADQDRAVARLLRSLEWNISRHFSNDDALEILLGCVPRSCTNPLDRIFALRRLLGAETIDDLRPDYSLAASELYRRFVVACLQHHIPVDAKDRTADEYCISCIFALVGTEKDSFSDEYWPSWVPNFNDLTERSIGKLGQYRRSETHHSAWQFYADPGLFQFYVDPTKPGELQLRGRSFATVCDVSDETIWPSQTTDRNLPQGLEANYRIWELAHWYMRCLSFSKTHSRDSRIHEYFDGFLLQVGRPGFLKTRNRCMVLREELTECSLEDVMEFIRSAESYLKTMDTGRTLCHLLGEDFEDIAWVPKTARIGDKFCIFAGEPYDFLVRPRTEGRFSILGDTWLATASLKQALGGTGDTAMRNFALTEDPAMNWESEDKEMRRLIPELGWVTLC